MSDSSDIRTLPRFRPGDSLSHAHINGLVDAFRGLEVRGVGVRQDGNKIQISSPSSNTISLVLAHGIIPAMSGAFPGKGKAVPQWIDPSNNQMKSTGEQIDVYNIARTSSYGDGSIRDGQMCLLFSISGISIAVPVEC